MRVLVAWVICSSHIGLSVRPLTRKATGRLTEDKEANRNVDWSA